MSRPRIAKNALKMRSAIGVWTICGWNGPRNDRFMAASVWARAFESAGEHRPREAARQWPHTCYLWPMADRPPAIVSIARALVALGIEAALLAWGLGGVG